MQKRGKKIQKRKIERQRFDLRRKYYTLWFLDNKVRPCFGTTEHPHSGRLTPAKLNGTGGAKRRVRDILHQLSDAKIRLDDGVMTYNYNKKTIDEFHLKYAMSPKAFKIFLQLRIFTNEGFKPTASEWKKLNGWYKKEYYGDKLRELQNLKKQGNTHTTDRGLIHARDYNGVLKTGSVVLYNIDPVKSKKLTDDMIVKFEDAVRETFADETWFAVCFYVTEEVYKVGEAKLLIGAKIDEKQFILKFQPFSGNNLSENYIDKAAKNPEKGIGEVYTFFKKYKYIGCGTNYWNLTRNK